MSRYMEYLTPLWKSVKLQKNPIVMLVLVAFVGILSLFGLPFLIWDLYEYRKRKKTEHPDFIKVIK
ncbi:MAG: hypothetical protein QW292_09305 [Candidatus Parvarchaeota archaeon]